MYTAVEIARYYRKIYIIYSGKLSVCLCACAILLDEFPDCSVYAVYHNQIEKYIQGIDCAFIENVLKCI